jgi:diamine N-acetyltransferase
MAEGVRDDFPKPAVDCRMRRRSTGTATETGEPQPDRATGGTALPIVIRRAGPADALTLSRFARMTFRAAFAAQNDPAALDEYLETAFSPDIQAAEIAADGSEVLLAVDHTTHGEQLAGYVHLVEDPPSMQLRRLYVDPARAGNGLGARLVTEAVAVCGSRGFNQLWLGVWENNVRAIAFYKRAGFRICGETRFHFGPDIQRDLLMELDLSNAG